MKDTKRALRRHHRRRMIARALRYGRVWGLGFSPDKRRDWAVRHFDTLQMCACRMCNRPRFWWGPTTQERRWNARERIIEVGVENEDERVP